MTMNPLPPQAYTKDTVVQAYAWLQSQPDSIKELATTPDTLVSLYLKAKLQGNAALERPSIQNFKNELKSLAGLMGEFEGQEIRSQQPIAAAPTKPVQAPQPAAVASPSTSMTAATMTSGQFDPKSLEAIRFVQNEFNLSSENEALRLLISTGLKTLKKL